MTFLKQIDGRWQGRGNASPRDFFQSAEPGFNLDFSTTAPLYQDNLAATPLTLPDTAIGLAADRSRTRSPVTSYAALQASAGLRPKWGRAPVSRRNQLRNTNDMTALLAPSTTTFTGLTVTANTVANPLNGAVDADLLVPAAGTSLKSIRLANSVAQANTYSFYIKSNGVRYFNASWSTAVRNAAFDIVAGIVVQPTVDVGGTSTITSVGDGWFRISFPRPSTSMQFYLTVVDSFAQQSYPFSATNNGTDGFYLWGAQMEAGAVATALQTVGATTFDMTEAGLPSFGYARWGLDDDVLTVTTPEAQTGDVMIFGRKGSWLQEGVAYGSGAAVAIGPTTMTGLPAGLLAAVQGAASDASGGIVGVLAIGRTLSAAERTLALDYHKARGALGWLVPGAELINNGGFDLDAIWSKGAGWAIGGGIASITAAAGTSFLTQAAVPTEIGRAYLTTFDYIVSAGSIRLNPGLVGVGSTIGVGSGTMLAIVVATATSHNFSIQAINAGTTASVDNVSVKPLTVTP